MTKNKISVSLLSYHLQFLLFFMFVPSWKYWWILLWSHIDIILFQKKILEWSVKKFQNDFLEKTHPSKYWFVKYNVIDKSKNDTWLTDEVCFDIWFGEIEIPQNDSGTFLWIIPRFFSGMLWLWGWVLVNIIQLMLIKYSS